jgi:small-conductance mechanosensitive channel
MLRIHPCASRRAGVRHAFVLLFAALAAWGRIAFAAEAAAEPAGVGPDLERGLLWLALCLLGGLAAAKLLVLVWKHVLLPIARRTRTTLDATILEATRRPMQPVALLVALYLGASTAYARLAPIVGPAIWSVWVGALYVGLVLSITLLLYATAHAFMDWYAREFAAKTASKLDDQFVALFRKAAKFVFLFIALTIIFGHFNIQVTGLLATAGVASLAVAFAAQETIANMIAGLVLMVDRPFAVGDRVELANGQIGDVIDVGLRSTKVLSFDNTVITLPNSDVAKSQIINLNAPDPRVKIRQTIGVAYGTDLRKVKATLLSVMDSHSDILKDPAPATYFSEFAESSLNVLFVCWVPHYRDKFRIVDEINMAIKDRFEAEGIEIPFPQRDVHVRMVGMAARPVSEP